MRKLEDWVMFVILMLVGIIGGCSVPTHTAAANTEAPAVIEYHKPGTPIEVAPSSVDPKIEVKEYNGLPWLVTRDTGEVLATNVLNAYYYTSYDMLQVTYQMPPDSPELPGQIVDVTYDNTEVQLMTPNGPCTIEGQHFICPDCEPDVKLKAGE